MNSKNNYPLYVKWLDIVPWIMARTERFPKNLRYSLSQKIDNTCLEVLELIVQAIYSQSKRETLQKINLKLDLLRALLQMSFKMQRLSESQYEYISRELMESGKMVGGWLKSA
ncbi:MAG: diversity-generating retroelement protein Avd [Candidatus Cloacimonadaceae bacterium]|nr:diversity-generating retroelement protein Avd [Candidatus Cloacimonadota bacterium]MCB5259017.1 diversity-generating retroelement protein Avd [Candidatus Cloacimonadota bacterium]